MELNELKVKSQTYAAKVATRTVKRDILRAEYTKAQEHVSELTATVELKGQVIVIFSEFVDNLWGDTRDMVEQVVTRGVQTCFNDNSEVKVRVEVKKNQIVAEPYLLVDGEERDILTGDGGGLADVVATLLRVAILLLKRPALDKILIFDEPYKCLSAEHIPLMVDFMAMLSEAFGIQLIIATHIGDFKRTGTHYIVKKVNKCTQVQKQEFFTGLSAVYIMHSNYDTQRT